MNLTDLRNIIKKVKRVIKSVKQKIDQLHTWMVVLKELVLPKPCPNPIYGVRSIIKSLERTVSK